MVFEFAGAQASAPLESKEYTFPITVSGRAIDDAGKAVVGAEIYLAARSPGYRRLAETKTAADGSYRFEKISLPIERGDTNAAKDAGAFEVFGIAEGYALAWRPRKSFYPDSKHVLIHPADPKEEPTLGYGSEDTIELDLTFETPTTIRGRVVDDQGQPIPKASLAIRYCDTQWDQPDYSTSGGWGSLDALNAQAIVPPRIKTRSTDADGRFEFSGLPSDYRWSIDVRPPGHPPRRIWAVTRDGIHADATGRLVYSGDFEIIFPRPRQVRFRVAYDDTGQPAAKVGLGGIVTEAGFWKTTDEEGFVETPLPDGRYRISVLPRYGSHYLRTEAQIEVSAESVKVPYTILLPPAAVVDISVVDADTGKPLAGVDVTLNGSVHGYRSWEVETRISHYERPRSDKQGKMRVLFEPGRHRIGVGREAYPQGYVPVDPDGKEIDCQPGQPIVIEFQMRRMPPPEARSDDKKPDTRKPMAPEAAQPSGDQPKLAADAQQPNLPSAPSIVVARHVLLLEGKEIVTWAELEKRIAALPDPSLVHPSFYITRGAMEAGAYQLAKDEIWRLRLKFKFKGHSQGSLRPRSDLRYDRIEKPSDLVPDEKLRVEGKVVDRDGQPVVGAEVILVTPIDPAIAYKSYDMALVEGRIRNRLEHVMTESDAAGGFALYPSQDEVFHVIALHPQAGFTTLSNVDRTKQQEVKLWPWASLVVEIEEEPGVRQQMSLGTTVPLSPEVNISQYSSELKGRQAAGAFRFTHVPPIWDTAISRSFPDAEGVSIGIPGASVSLLAGETRRISLGGLTEQQRELLEERRREIQTRRGP